ncbi:hypothetical protein QVD17_24305 [Tagetes erecta]|uniref:Reverse transcriptase n=1 Tax=Tagetes erecta TaxID=13708 RepID=A0AAD8KEZ0_TARER|nr:hypothetical protein QVD17_24305 [Tagetes erecta]
MGLVEAAPVRSMATGIASKVKNIDGHPTCGVLKKTGSRGTNEKEDQQNVESIVGSEKTEGMSYAQSLQVEDETGIGKKNTMEVNTASTSTVPQQHNAFEVLSSVNENGNKVDEEVETKRKHNGYEVLSAVYEEEIHEDMEEVEMEQSEVAKFVTHGTNTKSAGASTPGCEEEAVVANKFKEASLDEERYLKQKSKIDWLAEGDNNTAFFHNSLKVKNHRSRIDVILDGGGTIHEGENVQKAFVNHYEKFLGIEGDVSLVPTPELFCNRLDEGTATNMVIMRSLADFTAMSGLVPSTAKSTIYFCNVPDNVRLAILNIMPFVEGSLPVKYLGVPLISSRLIYRDCKWLVEKMERRIENWKNRMLSFAGRLQLIGSVLSSLYIYWASVFILPKRVIADLENKMRGFLWSQGSVSQGKAKVAWKSVCLPKREGGLGIRRIGDMNTALMTYHIWSLISKRKSLWVDWVYSYRLSNCNFWESNIPQNCCWTWRKILKIRPKGYAP